MSVVNGQLANQTTFNNAFMSRLAPATSTISVVSLQNTLPESGLPVDSAQKAINKAFEGIGTTGEDDVNINNYASENYIADGDSRKVAVEKLDTQLKSTQDDLDLAEIEIAAHEVRLDDHDVTLADHESRLDAAELTIADHETRLDAAELTIADHESRIDAAELTIADHETRLDTIETLPSTFGGDKIFSDDVVIQGNLEVQGTVTTINSTIVEVADASIVVNNGGTDASAEGAGLEIERVTGNAGLVFDSTLASKFKIGFLASLYEVVVSGVAQTVAGLKNFTTGIMVDAIDESTLDAGVTVEGVLIKDGQVDGRDVSTDGAALDSHIANTSNPHAVTAAQVGADPAGTAAAAVSAHEAVLDPHPQYLTQAEGDGLYDAFGAAATVQGNLDTHTGDTNNPHATTAAQVGLGNVTDDAQLKRSANDWAAFTEKTIPHDNDRVLIEDSENALVKKWVKKSALASAGGAGGTKTIEFKINGQYVVTGNGVDGFWVAPVAVRITNVFIYQEVAGSSGTTNLDLKVKPFLSGAFTSIFLTTPKATPSAGANAWCGVGDSVTGLTAPVLTSLPFTLAAKSALRLDILGLQSGANTYGLIVAYEEI